MNKARKIKIDDDEYLKALLQEIDSLLRKNLETQEATKQKSYYYNYLKGTIDYVLSCLSKESLLKGEKER